MESENKKNKKRNENTDHKNKKQRTKVSQTNYKHIDIFLNNEII